MANSESSSRQPRADRWASEPVRSEHASQPPARCPWCGSEETEPMALFGAHLLVEQHYCRACHTPFERIVEGKR